MPNGRAGPIPGFEKHTFPPSLQNLMSMVCFLHDTAKTQPESIAEDDPVPADAPVSPPAATAAFGT